MSVPNAHPFGKTRLVHAPEYNTDLAKFGIDKPFALDRGDLVLKQLAIDLNQNIPILRPEPISDEQILLVHTSEYLNQLSRTETWMNIFEFKPEEFNANTASKPLPELLDDIRLKCGGTRLACEVALEIGMAANLGGGYHHAYPDHGSGFCVLHDIAIAIKDLKRKRLIERVLIVDLDFHQGDGTAVIFKDDPAVFTLSVHSKEGWPDEKQVSSLDVEIAEHETGDYLERTKEAVLQTLETFSPDLVVFVAGSDPYEKDVLPGTRFIKLSLETLLERDKFVIDTMADRQIPLAMVFSGGYGPDVWEVHYGAVKHLLIRSM